MALNCADTRQRAYNRIDTSNPAGNWIDEKAFNRARPGNTMKILVGNWQEERVLEGDMTAKGFDNTTLRKVGKYYQGGHESTAYLLSPLDQEDRRTELSSTQRADFSEANSDVKSQLPHPLGLKRRLEMNRTIELAKEEAATMRTHRFAAEKLSTTYRDTLGTKEDPRRVVERVSQEYVADIPITLYTKNPVTETQMKVQGMTCVSESCVNPLGRSTQFSHSKYTL